MRLLLSVVAISLLLGIAPTPAQAATPEATYRSSAIKATNHERSSRSIKELTPNDCLQKFAVRQAKKMAAQEEMFHQDLGPILQECHVTKVGENVAAGYPNGKAVVKAWMHSEGHRANILDSDFRLIGLAARKGDNGTWYVSQVFGRK